MVNAVQSRRLRRVRALRARVVWFLVRKALRAARAALAQRASVPALRHASP